MLQQLTNGMTRWVGAALGAEGARANVAADLADLHARRLEVEALVRRLARIAPLPSPSARPGRARRAA